MENLDAALPVMAHGVIVVFVVMTLIALLTWGMGQVFIRWDKKEAERKQAEQAEQEAEKERKKAEKARKKAEREEAAAARSAAAEAPGSGGEPETGATEEQVKAEGGSGS